MHQRFPDRQVKVFTCGGKRNESSKQVTNVSDDDWEVFSGGIKPRPRCARGLYQTRQRNKLRHRNYKAFLAPSFEHSNLQINPTFFQRSRLTSSVGADVAASVVGAGVAVGMAVGVAVGEAVGVAVGTAVGVAVGMTVLEGASVGEEVGVPIGADDGPVVKPFSERRVVDKWKISRERGGSQHSPSNLRVFEVVVYKLARCICLTITHCMQSKQFRVQRRAYPLGRLPTAAGAAVVQRKRIDPPAVARSLSCARVSDAGGGAESVVAVKFLAQQLASPALAPITVTFEN